MTIQLIRALITILNNGPPIAVDDDLQVKRVLRDAAAEARTRGKLGAILIEAANKNSMTMVVGSSNTILSFGMVTEILRTMSAKKIPTKMNRS
jgi:hypothetical protein